MSDHIFIGDRCMNCGIPGLGSCGYVVGGICQGSKTPAEERHQCVGQWRVGRKVGRTIYWQQGSKPADDDPLIGVMDTRELAAQVVRDHMSVPVRAIASKWDAAYRRAVLLWHQLDFAKSADVQKDLIASALLQFLQEAEVRSEEPKARSDGRRKPKHGSR